MIKDTDEYSGLDFGWDKFQEIKDELDDRFSDNPDRHFELQCTLLRCVIWDCVLDNAEEEMFLDYLTWLFHDCKDYLRELTEEDALKTLNEIKKKFYKSKPNLRLVKK